MPATISCASKRTQPETRRFGTERRVAERAANQRLARDAVEIGERADLQPVAIAVNRAKLRHVADVDDHAVAVTRILEAEKRAPAGAPADAPAMDECEAQRLTQMTRPCNLRCLH